MVGSGFWFAILGALFLSVPLESINASENLRCREIITHLQRNVRRYTNDAGTVRRELEDSLPSIGFKLTSIEMERGIRFSRSYLRRVVERRRIDLNRSYYRERARLERYGQVGDIVDPMTPYEAAITREQYNDALRIVSELGPDYVEIFRLKVIEGLRHVEISQALGIPVATSKSRFKRLMDAIQAKLLKKKTETDD